MPWPKKAYYLFVGEAEELADNAENGDNNLQEAQSSQPTG